jgi:hypothetical protein
MMLIRFVVTKRRTEIALTPALSRQAGEGGLSLQVDATLSPIRGEGRGEGKCVDGSA